MKSIFFIFISLAAIAVGEQDFSDPVEVDYHQGSPARPQDPGSRKELNIENVDRNHEYSVQSRDEHEFLNRDAEKAMKSWVTNMDCSEALMGEVKCIIVKNLSEEYYNNPDITPSMATAGIEWLIRNLHAEGQVDPVLDIIIHKHFKEYLDLES